ncbi:MAG: hypothetical protein ABR524_05310 [Thermoanaerobaculia bacterium]
MRPFGEIFRRGMESAIANWPLILIRVAESIAVIAIVVMAVMAALVPLFVGAATGLPSIDNPEAFAEWVLGVSPLLVLFAIVVVSVVFGLAVLVHSFVTAGVFGVFAAAENRAPEGGGRDWFRVFTPELWWINSKRFVWTYFWIYNIVWGVAALAMLLPLIPALIGAMLLRDSEMILIPTCLGIAATVAIGIVAGMVAIVWSHVAFAEAVRTGAGARESLRLAGVQMRRRGGAILLVVVSYFALSMVVGGFVAGFAFGLDAANIIPGVGMALIPFRIVLSLLNSLVSAAFGSWMIAAIVATVFPPREVSNVPAAT